MGPKLNHPQEEIPTEQKKREEGGGSLTGGWKKTGPEGRKLSPIRDLKLGQLRRKPAKGNHEKRI